MAITVQGSGTLSPTINVETNLMSAIASAGIYLAVVDFGAMVAGDVTELRWYYTVLSAGTERRFQRQSWRDALLSPIVSLGPVVSDISCRPTLWQTGGTARSYPWKILKVG